MVFFAHLSWLVVAPCGWTRDDDIDMVLDAFAMVGHPGLTLYLTGDGPLKAQFQQRLDGLDNLHSGYLPEAEYRDLLGRADLGLSSHHSSSGLDLAMKVSDLFAARAPVCAWDYGGALPEQVVDGQTGYLFRDARALATILQALLADPSPLESMRLRIADQWQETAQQAWDGAWAEAVSGLPE